MVASIKPHRDELGLGDGRMLIDGDWVTAADEATWSHRAPRHRRAGRRIPGRHPGRRGPGRAAARRAFDEGPWPRARATSGSGCCARSRTWSASTPTS